VVREIATFRLAGGAEKKDASPARGRLGRGKKALPAPLPVPPRRDLRQEGLKKKDASPARGRLGRGKKALPAPLPVPPRRDLRQEGMKK